MHDTSADYMLPPSRGQPRRRRRAPSACQSSRGQPTPPSSVRNEGRGFILAAPHLTIYPGLAIMLLVLGCHVLGDGLGDGFDPKQRGR